MPIHRHSRGSSSLFDADGREVGGDLPNGSAGEEPAVVSLALFFPNLLPFSFEGSEAGTGDLLLERLCDVLLSWSRCRSRSRSSAVSLTNLPFTRFCCPFFLFGIFCLPVYYFFFFFFFFFFLLLLLLLFLFFFFFFFFFFLISSLA